MLMCFSFRLPNVFCSVSSVLLQAPSSSFITVASSVLCENFSFCTFLLCLLFFFVFIFHSSPYHSLKLFQSILLLFIIENFSSSSNVFVTLMQWSKKKNTNCTTYFSVTHKNIIKLFCVDVCVWRKKRCTSLHSFGNDFCFVNFLGIHLVDVFGVFVMLALTTFSTEDCCRLFFTQSTPSNKNLSHFFICQKTIVFCFFLNFFQASSWWLKLGPHTEHTAGHCCSILWDCICRNADLISILILYFFTVIALIFLLVHEGAGYSDHLSVWA